MKEPRWHVLIYCPHCKGKIKKVFYGEPKTTNNEDFYYAGCTRYIYKDDKYKYCTEWICVDCKKRYVLKPEYYFRKIIMGGIRLFNKSAEW